MVLRAVKTMNAAKKRYLVEFGSSMFAYAVVLIAAVEVIQRFPHAAWRIPVAVAPVIPICFALWAFLRALGRMDELQRRIQLNAIGIGFGATGIVTFTYGFLELVGFPMMSYLWVLPMMAVFWGIGTAFATWRYAL